MHRGLKLINLNKILSQTLRGRIEDLQFPHLMECSSAVEAQHRKVHLVEWCEEECSAESGIPAYFL